MQERALIRCIPTPTCVFSPRTAQRVLKPTPSKGAPKKALASVRRSVVAMAGAQPGASPGHPSFLFPGPAALRGPAPPGRLAAAARKHGGGESRGLRRRVCGGGGGNGGRHARSAAQWAAAPPSSALSPTEFASFSQALSANFLNVPIANCFPPTPVYAFFCVLNAAPDSWQHNVVASHPFFVWNNSWVVLRDVMSVYLPLSMPLSGSH